MRVRVVYQTNYYEVNAIMDNTRSFLIVTWSGVIKYYREIGNFILLPTKGKKRNQDAIISR